MPEASFGDRDPLDICVFSERPIARAEVIVNARVIGGLPMLDGGEADDKIIAVLENDNQWGTVREVAELPPPLVDRLRHYFSTYKVLPGEESSVAIGEPYGAKRAQKVVTAAMGRLRRGVRRLTSGEFLANTGIFLTEPGAPFRVNSLRRPASLLGKR